MDMGLISLLGIIGSLALLMYLAFKGISLLVVGPIAAAVVLLISGVDVVEGMSGPYSESFAGFAKSNFLLFLISSIFGSLMGDSGAAKDLAYKIMSFFDKVGGKNKAFWTMVGISILVAILTIGGISAFVVVFTMVPLCQPIFKKMNLPWHLFIAPLAIGGSLFTATMIPGSPAIQNLIPMQYLGTDPKAAPVLAILCAVISIAAALFYLKLALNKIERDHEHYLPTGAVIEERMKSDSIGVNKEAAVSSDEEEKVGSALKALIPPIVLLGTLNIFNMSPISSLFFGVVAVVALYFNKLKSKLNKAVGSGALNAIKSLTGVCAVVGFGGVVSVVPGFSFLVNGLDKIPGPPLIQLVIATNLVAGICGSASGGLGIALETFSDHFLAMGISPQVIHRVAAISCYALDSLPHNGSVINKLSYAGLTHKEGYKHEFWITVVIAVIVSFLSAFFATLGII